MINNMENVNLRNYNLTDTNPNVVSSASEHFKAVLQTLKHNKVMVKTEKDGIYIRMAGNESKGESFSLDWAKVVSF